MKPQLSIIIPIYNEEKSIPDLLEAYKKAGKEYIFELICVNNGSTDYTLNILQQNRTRYRFVTIVTIKKNIGYGNGIMTGLKKARADIIAWTHADMQTPPTDVFKAFEIYKKKPDIKTIVKGKRLGRSFGDRVISFGMEVFATIFLGVPLSEINAQPKLFHQSFMQFLSGAPNDFSLDLFFLYQARKHRYTIVSFPVTFLKRKHGSSKWAYSLSSRIRMIAKTIRYILQLSNKNIF